MGEGGVMTTEKSDENRILSDVLVSAPVIVPSMEDEDLNGFAFSRDLGIIVSSNHPGDRQDALAKLRGWGW